MQRQMKKRKTRLIVKNSEENILLQIPDIAMFFFEQRLVFVIDKNGKQYGLHKSLTEIEEDLDNNTFFRANRRVILNINYIKSFTDCERNKLKVQLIVNHPLSEIVISQETAPIFKTWLCES